MNQELQALLRAYREFHEAPADRAEDLGFIYQALLLDRSKRAGFAPEVIERALKIDTSALYGRKATVQLLFRLKPDSTCCWCAREDLNLQSFRNQILSLAR